MRSSKSSKISSDQQLEGAGKVLDGEGTVDHRLFLVGIGVEVAAHVLHAVQDVPRLALAGTLEDEVLHEVRHARLVFALVARAGIHGKAAIGHPRSERLMDDAQPVGQGADVESGSIFGIIRHFGRVIRFTGAKIQ